MTLAASRCTSCERVDVPPEPRCPACTGGTEERQVPARGRVLAATRPAGGEPVALVELDGGARALCRWEGEAVPEVGAEASVTAGPAGTCSASRA